MLKLKVEKGGYIQATHTDDNDDRIVYEWDGVMPPLYIRLSHYFHQEFVGPGKMIPPWYYGLSYMEMRYGVSVFHLIPINLIVRASRWIGYVWARLRTRRSWFDKQVDKAYADGYAEGRSDLLREHNARK